MVQEQIEKLKKVVELVNNVEVDPDVTVDYFIPGVVVTDNVQDVEDTSGPFVQFTYFVDGKDPHAQRVPLTLNDLEKSPKDLADYLTFSLETFMAEIESRQFGAQ